MRGIVTYFLISFALHLSWENAQASLYADFVSYAQHFWPCFFGTITGDMVFMAVMYFAIAVSLKNAFWSSDAASYRHPATWVLPVITGVLLAVSYELWAIHAVQRWEYGTMPIIPIVRVGLTPVLQMIAVPIATIYLCFLDCRRRSPSPDPTM